MDRSLAHPSIMPFKSRRARVRSGLMLPPSSLQVNALLLDADAGRVDKTIDTTETEEAMVELDS